VTAAPDKLPEGMAGEPFGYWIEQKHADPVLLRKPAYIPEPSELRKVTPLYTHPQPAVLDEVGRDQLCRLIEGMCPQYDETFNLPIGGQVEALADAILAHIASTTAAAVQAETERCAKVVESYGETWGLSYRSMTDTLAAAIRTPEAE
jgi:hypothetical protein